MIRGIFKALSLLCLAVALVTAVLDVTRSIADQQIVLTPLMADWMRMSPDTLASTRNFLVDQLHPWLWSPILENFLRAPSWAVFALLSLFLAMGARERKRGWQENFGA